MKHDPHTLSHGLAQGDFIDKANLNNEGQQPLYSRMVVLDVIFDPQIIDNVKIDYWEHTLKVKNIRFAKSLPRNSIIAQRILDGSAPGSDPPMFLFPFFPSHLSLPCKPGEHVWVMFEHPDAKFSEMGYWMCRITEPHFVDDVNHTHSPRQFDASFEQSTKDSFDGNKTPVYEMRNGMVDSSQGQRYTRGGTAFMFDSENSYERLMTETDASKIETHEAVPRVRKRPGDVVIEGSNNSSIVLGSDRTGPVAKYNADEERGQVPSPTDDIQGNAGSIDIVSGRGQTPITGGFRVQSKKLSGGNFKEEIAKDKKSLVVGEGDPDFKNDRSRILVSQKTKVDANFSLDSFNMDNFEISDDDGAGAVVLKSDKVRIIARQDLQIIVKGYDTTDGKVTEKDDTSAWASVTIKTNGDIVFTPSSKGVLKLGGEDANLAVLCNQAITGPNDSTGNVTAAPILDSMGGAQGGGGSSGQFATKVVLK